MAGGVALPKVAGEPRAKIEGLSARGLRNLRRVCEHWLATQDEDQHGTRQSCRDFILVADRAIVQLEAETRKLWAATQGSES